MASVHDSFPPLPPFDDPARLKPAHPATFHTSPTPAAASAAVNGSENKENLFPSLPDEFIQQSKATHAQLLTPHKPSPSTRKGLHKPQLAPTTTTTTPNFSASSTSSMSRFLHRFERLSEDVSQPSAASFTLDPSVKDKYIIGRDATADLHLDSVRQPNMISRRHAMLQWSPAAAEWQLIDLRSVNGLYVNDVKAIEAALRDGDVVCFGGGAGVKDGQRREQPNSDFRFVYRRQQCAPEPQPSSPSPQSPATSSMPASADTMEYETALTPIPNRSMWLSHQRSISLPFSAHTTLTGDDLTLQPPPRSSSPQSASPLSPLTLALTSQRQKRKRSVEDEEHDTEKTEADRRRIAKMEEEKRELQEQYLMALAEFQKKDEDRREAEMRYRDESRRQQEEIRLERERVAAYEQERADKLARDAEERRRMEEETKKLEEEREKMDASQQEEKRRIQAELDSMRQRMDEMKEATESERTNAERIKEEFICQFCISALVAPLTLACSHSFCSSCLYGWFKSGRDNCISCRQPVNLPPIKALSLENAVERLLRDEELEEWKQRREQWTEEQRTETRRHRALIDHIEQTRRTNPASLSFLNINSVWSADEKKLFADGFAPYTKTEECRRAYCQLVGLSEEWIQQLARTVEDLKRACVNLQLKSDVTELSGAHRGKRAELEKAALQRRLWLFLRLGCKVT